MYRVGLVDDQQLVRAGFSMVLGSQDDIEVAWEASDGAEAVELAASNPVDVIFMDIQMPVLNGIEATKELIARKQLSPHGTPTRIVVLTTFDTDNYVVSSIEAGASGFLLKDTSPEELISAVYNVGESAAVISPAATAKLFSHLRHQQPPATGVAAGTKDNTLALLNHCLPDPLTAREAEILVLITHGKSNTEIADELFISLPTVKTHVGRILAKTNSRDRVHAVLFAIKNGVIPE
ncbi:two component transcriptional regulator, LuxR family [Corynebacterium mustelae]|uniref:Two component transcriptional regulator, LuxR family n=1 Tax=Corynebacterium mustelae TaxID=571915 RepID=A0A0G3GUD1_9CORY|nr:response regulator transcription factor [Corynebacterium mustelae]AKK04749.1 two component transcriptional regulator, LuxR family [Corynebacterium mustelae]